MTLRPFDAPSVRNKAKDMQRQTGSSTTGAVRHPEDYYVTPDAAVKALLERERFEGVGWEPAVGNGAIARFFPGMVCSDIRTDGSVAGERGVDFLKTTRKVDYIVTNPPFRLILPFAKHALECAPKVALFGRIQFLEGRERHAFFKESPPSRVWVFSDRVACLDGETGIPAPAIMCFAWFVWERPLGETRLGWILSS